ncbi:Flp pilus assembly complex ATPase component TadA [Clostridium sp. 19966]|uniref:ATPase, T2SS/T4P/T4SS family n=1 Tax=Clostridium sp. 19966 TaxID=2768166 RepID=UPI0028DE0F4D|nr:ATPase, T2SS/T4P/T4SS family [Clostridium sp. 19966]MDT8718228.1 Flp pilus assembly complex ATPase component TadA [Clostridium sp. 19966]
MIAFLSKVKGALLSKDIDEEKTEKYTLKNVQLYVEKSLEYSRRHETENTGMTSAQYRKQEEKRRTLLKISQNCGKGDIAAKLYMKKYIADIITKEYGVSRDNIDYIFNFKSPKTAQDKFEIILYSYKKTHEYWALDKLLDKYQLNKFRNIDGVKCCVITVDDINDIFSKESISVAKEKINLSFEDKLEIIVQRIYQDTKGLGVIDEIRDMFCDGISIGVSGVPIDFIGKLSDMQIRQNIDAIQNYKYSYDSIWLYRGKEIHLDFLSFGSQHELERVCKLIYKFHDTAQLTRSDGYIFTYMADLSRAVTFRPPFAESWCAFIRKFDVDPNLDILYKQQNYDIVKELLEFFGKGKAKLVVTGPQGVGKTTLLIAIIRNMYANTAIRVWEDYFEAFLRLKIPGAGRNIMTIRKTKNINGDKAIAAIKKSNGDITVITEAAEDEHIKYIIKVSQAASETTVYTHHANDADALVDALTNSGVNSGAFTNEESALKAVLKTLGFDVHPEATPDGERYIERITEFIIDDENQTEDILDKFANSRITDRDSKLDVMFEMIKSMYISKRKKNKGYKDVNIVEYDPIEKKYIITNPISAKRKKEIMKKLLPEDQIKFQNLMDRMEKMIEKGA